MKIKRFNVDMSVYKYFKQVSGLNVLLVNLCKLSGNTNKTKTSSFLSEFRVFLLAPGVWRESTSFYQKLLGKVVLRVWSEK